MEITGINDYMSLQTSLSKQASVDTSVSFDSALQAAMESGDNDALKKSCDELESFWIAELFKQMKSSMLTGETLMGEGDYVEMFEDQMFEALADEMVQAGGIGLSDQMYRQMTNSYKAQATQTNNMNIDQDV